MGEHDSVVVVAGGSVVHRGALDVPPDVAAGAPVVAADGGIDRALELGLEIALAVGDFDSVSAVGLVAAQASGARVERHPVDKDATDLELALDAALALSPRRIVVLGSDTGRLDHLLAALLLLGAERYAGVELDAALGVARVHVVRRERRLAAKQGELVSLLALHGPAEGVRTEGLVYELRGETLGPGSSRGVSNVFAAPEAHVAVERGVLLVVRPGEQERRQS